MYRYSCVLREKSAKKEFPVERTFDARNDTGARTQVDDIHDAFDKLNVVVVRETIEEGSINGSIFVTKRTVYSSVPAPASD